MCSVARAADFVISSTGVARLNNALESPAMTRNKSILVFVIAATTAVTHFFPLRASGQNSSHSFPKLLTSYHHHSPSCELGAALDLLAFEMTQDHEAYAHIIVYRGYNNPPSFFRRYTPSGLFYRHSLGVKNYLTKNRGIASERITIVDGGIRERFQADVWLVAENGKRPETEPTSAVETGKGEQQELLDEYIYDSENELADYFDSTARLEGFARVLSTEHDTVGYIIGYGQCLDITEETRVIGKGEDGYITKQYERCDPTGVAKRIARAEKNSLVEAYGIAPSRIIVVDGGYRNSQMIELWIGPSGGGAREPTPTANRRNQNGRN